MPKKNGFDTKALKGLAEQLDKLGVDSAALCQKLVEEAAEAVLKKQQFDAPKQAEDKGAWKHLAITEYKKSKKGAYANVGISAMNWARTDYLYYQHFGYTHYKSGERVEAHLGWLDNSFNQMKADIRYRFQSKLLEAIRKFKVKDGGN